MGNSDGPQSWGKKRRKFVYFSTYFLRYLVSCFLFLFELRAIEVHLWRKWYSSIGCEKCHRGGGGGRNMEMVNWEGRIEIGGEAGICMSGEVVLLVT